ncbi:alpha/beta hydrolase [Maricaulis sp.]|uniref:alpha/beta hydrolase n=1 Tax=Maricaulis sp. TaxID=1486257 RepID=UPI0026251596|nr:alpha/beta hydrolase [Maricaulis sp.]
MRPDLSKRAGHPVQPWLAALCVALCTLAAPALASAQSDRVYPSEMDVVYRTAPVGSGTTALQLDIYQPQSACTAPRPFIVMIHGGGFRQGSKTDAAWVEIAEAISAAGYVAITVDYRLEGEKPVPSPEFAAMRQGYLDANPVQPPRVQDVSLINTVVSATEDVRDAALWVQANAADRCIDPDRFAIWGSSAGAVSGQLISYALDDFGITGPRPQLFVDYWGRAGFPGMMAAGDPAIFILHGTADTVIPFSLAEALRDEAQAARLVYAFHPNQGAGHGFASNRIFQSDPSPFQRTLDFLNRNLPL